MSRSSRPPCRDGARAVARILLVSVVIGSCTPADRGPLPLRANPAADPDVLLSGQVMLPRGFQTKVTAAELVANAGVILTRTNGALVATGVTDATGAFRIFRATPTAAIIDGRAYLLEFTRRATAGGRTNRVAMRTLVRADSSVTGGWRSVTGRPVVINLHTTAVVRAWDTENLAPMAVMNVIGGANYDQVTPFGSQTQSLVDQSVAYLAADLADNRDPVGDRLHSWPLTAAITTQADLDRIANVEEVQGDLIVNAPALTTLSLPKLRRVTGNLYIGETGSGFSNPALTTLSLPRLRSVGGNVSIDNNPLLASLGGLAALTAVNGALHIQGCTALTSLQGLENVTAVDSLTLRNNDGLLTLAALGAVTGSLTDLVIMGNGALPNLAGLTGITRVTGQLVIRNNALLTAIGGLRNIVGPVQTLDMRSLPGVTTLVPLNGITNVSTAVTISNNVNLSSACVIAFAAPFSAPTKVLTGNKVSLTCP